MTDWKRNKKEQEICQVYTRLKNTSTARKTTQNNGREKNN